MNTKEFCNQQLSKEQKIYKKCLLLRVIFNPKLWSRLYKTNISKNSSDMVIDFLLLMGEENIEKPLFPEYFIVIGRFAFLISNSPYADGSFSIIEDKDQENFFVPAHEKTVSRTVALCLRDIIEQRKAKGYEF